MNVLRFKYLIMRFFHSLKNDNILVVLKKIFNTIFYSNKIDLDKLIINENLKLDDLFLKFGTDKGFLDGKKTYDFLKSSKEGRKQFKNYYSWINRRDPQNFDYQLGLNYTPYYEKYLDEIKDKALKILEVGVANGHSIASWFYYFKNSQLHAVDIKKSDKFFYKSKRIKYQSLDCMNDSLVKKYIKKNNQFDVVIDDSDHSYPAFTNNLKNFYPALKPGGIYILEDFSLADKSLEEIIKFNEKSGRRYMGRYSTLMHQIFENIKNKKMFKHEILKENNLKYIFDTVERVEVNYGEHPASSMGILFKRN